MVIRRLVVVALATAIFVVVAEFAPVLRERSRYSRARAQLADIAHRLDEFYLDNGFYPTTDQGLVALVGADSSPDPGFVFPKPEPGPTRETLARDPWGNRFFYASDGNSYRLGSFGPGGNRSRSRPEIVVQSPGR